jgi:hypothetical protein
MDGTTKEKPGAESRPGDQQQGGEKEAVSTTLGAITAAVNIVCFSQVRVKSQK